MATKDSSYIFKDKNKVISYNQFGNLILYQNYDRVPLEHVPLQKNDTLNQKHRGIDEQNDLKTNDVSWRTKMAWNSTVLDTVLGRKSNDKMKVFDKQSTFHSSTLSLHITAYENSNETTSSDSSTKFRVLSSMETYPFEFPRQQNNEDRGRPDIMEFLASQQLLNPNPAPVRRSQRIRRPANTYPSPGLTPRRARSAGDRRRRRSRSRSPLWPYSRSPSFRTPSPIPSPFRNQPLSPVPSPFRNQPPSPFQDDQIRPNPFQDDQIRPNPFQDDQIRPNPFQDDQIRPNPFQDDQIRPNPPPPRQPPPPRRPTAGDLAREFLNEPRPQQPPNTFLVASNGVYVFTCPKNKVRGSGALGADIFYEDHLGKVIQIFGNQFDASEFARKYASDNFQTLKIKVRTGWMQEVFPRPEEAPTLQSSRETLNALAAGIRTDAAEANHAIVSAIRTEMNQMRTVFRDEIAAFRVENQTFMATVNANSQNIITALGNAVNQFNNVALQLQQQVGAAPGVNNVEAVHIVVEPVPVVNALPARADPVVRQPDEAPNFSRISRSGVLALKQQYATSSDFALQLVNYCVSKKESLEGASDELKSELYKLAYIAENASTTAAQTDCRNRINAALPQQKNSILNGLRNKAKSSNIHKSILGPVGAAKELQLQQTPPLNGDEAPPEGTSFFVPKDLLANSWTRTMNPELKPYPLLLKPTGERHEYCIYAEYNPTGTRQRKYSYFMIDSVEETRKTLAD